MGLPSAVRVLAPHEADVGVVDVPVALRPFAQAAGVIGLTQGLGDLADAEIVVIVIERAGRGLVESVGRDIAQRQVVGQADAPIAVVGIAGGFGVAKQPRVRGFLVEAGNVLDDRVGDHGVDVRPDHHSAR